LAEAAVELDGVIKRFGEVVAVEELHLSIADGEFFSLLGPSGCGKTTTLRMIAGLEFPTEGSIRVHGFDMGLRPPNERPINTVFQSYALFPHMTVAGNVAFGLQMRKVPKSEVNDRVARTIDLVRLAGMEDRKPRQLSGGQQQRVALARALVNEPQVLLLDEPLGALDLKLREAMQLELKDLQQRVGITFIYVTHDQQEALTMSNRIGVMNHGRLLQVGSPEEIYERPADRFVAGFIGETNFIAGKVVDGGRVSIADGLIVGAVTTSEPGTEVTLLLRPECVSLHGSPEEVPVGQERLEGRVRRRLYYGDALYYEVDLDAGPMVDARMENIGGVPRYESGDRVVIGFAPDAAEALEN
jgi:spermidine/putrescine transport system ATP-binding protein